MKEFATNLKQIRLENDLTQEELAKELNVSIHTYRNWEAVGKTNRSPKIEMIIKIADLLKVPLDALVGRNP